MVVEARKTSMTATEVWAAHDRGDGRPVLAPAILRQLAEQGPGRRDQARRLAGKVRGPRQPERVGQPPRGGEEIHKAEVWKGEEEETALGLKNDLYVTIPRGQYDQLKAEMDVKKILVAPIDTTAQLGAVRVSIGEEVIAQAPLYALAPVERGGLWTRIVDEVLLWFE